MRLASGAARAPAAESPESLSLGAVLAVSLTQNPDLVTVRGTINVSSSMVDTASVYPWNPFVQAQFFPNGAPYSPSTTPGGGAGQSNYYVWLMQRFELGHQRMHRKQSALAAFGQVRWNVRLAELNNIALTERLYFTALYQRQLLELAADAETLADHMADIVGRRFQSGLATSIEVSNARVAARQARRQRQLADATYQTALLSLKQQMGLPPNTPLMLGGNLAHFEWRSASEAYCHINPGVELDATTLAGELAESRPDVMAARSAAAVADANLSLARSARIQDVQAGPIYETADDGTRYLGLRLQRDFGVFNNGAMLVSQREAELRQQTLAHSQLRRRAANEAAAAIERYDRARAFAAQAAAEAESTRATELDQAIAQYQAGKLDIVNVLTVQNNLLADERASLDLFNEVAQAASAVTQTTGLPPERLASLPRAAPVPPPPPSPAISPPRKQPAARPEALPPPVGS